MVKVLSLGCGVQSSTLLCMAAVGVLPPLDAAVFADTGWEAPWTYEQAAYLRGIAAAAGIDMHTVTKGNIRDDMTRAMVRGTTGKGERWASMPLYTKNADGTVGMLQRQCTKEYKIEIVERCIREEILKIETRGRRGQGPACELWLGISEDESDRQTRSTVKWKVHAHPLLHRLFDPSPLGRGYSRRDCEAWLRDRGFRVPKKSACRGCPYRSNAEWMLIREDPAMWEDACRFDEEIRHCGGMAGEVFIHKSCVPLRQADLSTPDRWDEGIRNECAGVCGV